MIAAALLGLAAGVVAGMLGVGGGILFVPALTLALGLPLVEAEATSLLAIIPVALVGAERQRRYGNVRLGDAGVLGILSAAGAAGGVAAANQLPERALQIGFAGVLLLTAWQVARRGLEQRRARRAGAD